MKRLLFVWLLCLCLGDGMASAQKSEPILVGYGRDAKWSPGETSISLIRNDSLFVTRLDSTKETKFVHYGPIFKYEWVDDSTLAAQERYDIPVKNGRIFVEKIVKLSVAGQVFEVAKDSFHTASGESRRLNLIRLPDGTAAYFDNQASAKEPVRFAPDLVGSLSPRLSPTDIYVGTDPYPWGKVCLYYGSTDRRRLITKGASTWSLPRLAPTQDRFFCHNHRGEIIVFDTLDNIIANLGKAEMACWDPQGQNITFAVCKDGHYDIEKSDIFLVRYDGTERRQLTNTADRIEIEPSFSPSSRYIMYTDYDNNALYILRVE